VTLPAAPAATVRSTAPVLLSVLSVAYCVFTLAEVNYPRLTPQSQLAIFAMFGLVLCFLYFPAHPRLAGVRSARAADLLLAALSVACCAYIVWQTEPAFAASWFGGRSLGNRAGYQTAIDTAVGVAGLVLVLESTRRSIGAALPLLSMAFVAYAYWGAYLPEALFPHRGYPVERIVAQTFLHTQGVFGVALSVMFTYVFLFVIFGAFLQVTGATRFIIDFAQRLFGRTPGGPAKVAVLSSGMMGSLSGSAVANTATTGTFTIPMMRSAGFRAETAAGVEAAASSGGALVPPVMGAGAYMMLEIVQPPVTYLQIIQAALLPAILYYLALFLFVHFYARQLAATAPPPDAPTGRLVIPFEGVVFVTGLAGLLALLFIGYTAFRAVSLALGMVIVVSSLHPRTRIDLRRGVQAVAHASKDIVPLVCAAACVGIVIGVVTLTGIGTRLPAAIIPLADQSVLMALVVIMLCSIVLGMGLPSAVTYLLLATLIGPVLGNLGVVPLAAHLFIFYFGMMSMVTPPVALAAYAAASIGGADVMRTGFAAFRISLVGFTLPYMFVFRPELLMLAPDGGPAPLTDIAQAFAIGALGVLAFAAGMAGYLVRPAGAGGRALFFVASGLLLAPGPSVPVLGFQLPVLDVAGIVVLAVAAAVNARGTPGRSAPAGPPPGAALDRQSPARRG
jgi:TRAP transporter 4TM/12TM fusion protein